MDMYTSRTTRSLERIWLYFAIILVAITSSAFSCHAQQDISVTSLTYQGKPFAKLGTVINGRTQYCTDCIPSSGSPAVCNSGGTGAWAFGQNNQWMCSPGPNVLAQLPNYIGPINLSGNQTNGNDQANHLCVNGECPVTAFGAKGDCSFAGPTTSCTNNHNAIQAAINWAYAHGASVYFPANPSATGVQTPTPGTPPYYTVGGQTIYYTSTFVNPEGVSMHGPYGSSGNRFINQPLVAVRGAPGQDVFALVDVGQSGYVYPISTFSVENLGIIVDDSLDVHASFPNRILGRFCNDAVWNSGSTTVTSAAQCNFQNGDIGQNVIINGVNAQIATWTSPNQVTITVTSGSNYTGSMEIGAYRFPANQTIGNCAWAYPESSAPDVEGSFGSRFHHVTIVTTDNHWNNNSCGMYFQGNAYAYQNSFDLMNITAEFGMVFGNSIAPTSSINSGIGDYNHFKQVWILANYPWTSYNGSFNEIDDMQLSYSIYGPQILASYGVEPYPGYWQIDIPELECNSTAVCPAAAGGVGFRISGIAHQIERLRAGYYNYTSPGTPVAVEWDASACFGGPVYGATISPWIFAGDANSLYISEQADTISNIQDVSRGDNTITAGHEAGPIGGVQPSRRRVIGTQNLTIGSPILARQIPAFQRTSDFLRTGDGQFFYTNGEDLWYWPKDLITSTNAPPTIVADGSSDSGFDAVVSANTSFVGSVGAMWQVPLIPSVQSILYVKGISPSGTQTATISVTNPGGTTIYGTVTAASFASGVYTIIPVPTNLGGLGPGARIYINFSSLSGQINVSWMGWQPLSRTGFEQGPGFYWGGSGPPLPACTLALVTQDACVTDQLAACADGTTYANGGSNACHVRCNQTGTLWKDDGLKCY